MCICICICIRVYVIAFVSTLDIYIPNQVAAGVRHLKEFFGLPHQTCVMSQQRKILAMAQMTFNQCTSMSELKFDSVAPPGGQI